MFNATVVNHDHQEQPGVQIHQKIREACLRHKAQIVLNYYYFLLQFGRLVPPGDAAHPEVQCSPLGSEYLQVLQLYPKRNIKYILLIS